VRLVRELPRSRTRAAGPVEGKWQGRQNQQRMERRRKDEGRGEMEGAEQSHVNCAGRLRNTSMSDRNETEDMTAATCSKLSSNPAAGRECMDSSTTVEEDIDTDDQPYRRQQYLYPSSSSWIRAVGD